MSPSLPVPRHTPSHRTPSRRTVSRGTVSRRTVSRGAAVLVAAAVAGLSALPASAGPATRWTSPTPATSRPVPPAVRAAIDRRAARLAAHPQDVTRTAALAPPFSRVDVPARVEIGGRVTRLGVSATMTSPQAYFFVQLSVSGEDSGWGVGAEVEPTDPTRLQTVFELDRADFAGDGAFPFALGAGEWDLYAVPDPDGRQFSAVSLPTSVRAHSLLGLSVTRSGDTLSVTGSARAYDVPRDRYLAWHGRAVLLQRWTSTGWATVRTLTTDDRGNVATTLRVPFTVGLRAVDADSSTIWGATSASTIR